MYNENNENNNSNNNIIGIQSHAGSKLLYLIYRNIKASSDKLASLAKLKEEAREFREHNSELIKSNEELKSKLEEFNSSVGDEVPALINQNAKLKTKLKAEQATVDRLQDEVKPLFLKHSYLAYGLCLAVF